MANIETSIKWFYDRRGKVTYSMQQRNGPGSYDCSSAGYYALVAGGYFPSNIWIGNTDSLYRDLEKYGWVQIPADGNGYIATKRGDVFLWGKRGASGGGAGHTGLFVDVDNIIHCAYGYNGIHVDNHDWLSAINGYPELTVYRYMGAAYNPPSIPGSPTDQVLEIGSTIKFTNTYRVDDVQLVDGTWQVRTNVLCPKGFTWADNGIPTDPLVEIDSDGHRTVDQELAIGSSYKLPSKYSVLDLGESEGMWLALIEVGGLRFWVDVATATEIAASDAGTPQPQNRPGSPPVPPVQPETPKPDPIPIPEPEVPIELEPTAPDDQHDVDEEEPAIQEPSNPEANQPNPKEDKPMAFSREQQQELAVQTQAVLDANEFAPVISDKVKTVAYFATDITAVTSALAFTLLAIFGTMDAIIAITVNAAVTTALLGLKQTFRLSSKKQ